MRHLGDLLGDDSERGRAVAMVGSRVHFAHERGGPAHNVISASDEGGVWMLALDDLVGLFSPHLFVRANTDQSLFGDDKPRFEYPD